MLVFGGVYWHWWHIMKWPSSRLFKKACFSRWFFSFQEPKLVFAFFDWSGQVIYDCGISPKATWYSRMILKRSPKDFEKWLLGQWRWVYQKDQKDWMIYHRLVNIRPFLWGASTSNDDGISQPVFPWLKDSFKWVGCEHHMIFWNLRVNSARKR